MIYANHKKWADSIFKTYLNGLLKRHFYAIYLLNPVPDLDPQKPILLLPNHSTWWDGFFIYLLNKHLLHRKLYLMMLEEQLNQNRFFRYLGAYAINNRSFRGIKQALYYTIDLLNDKNKSPLVCFFPQGQLQYCHQKPIAFKRGLEFILKNVETEINLCFLAIHIEFLGEQRPEVFLQIQSIKDRQHTGYFSISFFEKAFNLFLDQFETDIVIPEKRKRLLQGKKSVNERFHNLWHKGC